MNSERDSVREMIATWDDGGIIWSIDMGGLGPGYEQVIQIGIIELCRRMVNVEIPEWEEGAVGEQINKLFDDALHVACKEVAGLKGITGAQAGAMKQVAYNAITEGWPKMVESIPKGRKIQVSNNWPSAAAV